MAKTDSLRFFPATIALLLLSSTLLLTSATPASAPLPQLRRRSPRQRRPQSPPAPLVEHPPAPLVEHPPPPVEHPPPPPALDCSTEVLAFSPCLPYISNPPNNIINSPSIQCCNAFESAFSAGEANCLCYLARQTLMFGVPINATKLYFLSSLCPKIDNVRDGNGALQSICSGSSRFFPATIALLLLSSTLLLTSAAPTSVPLPQLRRRSPRPRRLQSPPPPPVQHPPPPPALGCSTEVLAFSPCLPYISNPPNNITNSPSIQCCNAFESAFRAGEANCLCYLARQTLMFGFPINATKLYSLSSLCPKIDNVTDGNGTLQSICSVSAALPPLSSTPGSGFSTPHNLDFGSSLPPINIPLPKPSGDLVLPESADHAPSQPIAPVISANLPSESDQLSKTRIWMMSHTLLFTVFLTVLQTHYSW